MGVFGLSFGLVGPDLYCLVPRPVSEARFQLSIRTPRARPRKKHRVGVSSGARPKPAPLLLFRYRRSFTLSPLSELWELLLVETPLLLPTRLRVLCHRPTLPSFARAALSVWPPLASPRHSDPATVELLANEEVVVLFGLGRRAVVLPCSGPRSGPAGMGARATAREVSCACAWRALGVGSARGSAWGRRPMACGLARSTTTAGGARRRRATWTWRPRVRGGTEPTWTVPTRRRTGTTRTHLPGQRRRPCCWPEVGRPGPRWSSVPWWVRAPIVTWRCSRALRDGWGGQSCGVGELYMVVGEERAAEALGPGELCVCPTRSPSIVWQNASMEVTIPFERRGDCIKTN